jgi:hypothetical protein
MSYREADCCFRQNLDLDSILLWDTIFEFDVNCIYEEQPPVKHGVYELRFRYNKGLIFVKENKAKGHPKLSAGIDRLKKLAIALTNLKYPMYVEEKVDGFELE